MEILSAMRLFVEVAKSKNFRRAAKTLGISNSTLSRNIAELEKTVGLRLLHRSTRNVELTEAGDAYFRRCQSIVEEAQEAHEALLDVAERPSGTLRISMPADLATVYLAPILRDFAQAYPQVSFELDLTPRQVDLLAGHFDLAIRVGPAPTAPSMLVARQIALVPRYLYAAPSYLETAPVLNHPTDLCQHKICMALGTGTLQNKKRTFFRANESISVLLAEKIAMNNVGLSRALAVLGMGVAVLSEEIAREDLAAGRLQRVLPDWKMAPVPIHAITETRLLPARTRLFIEFLKAGMRSANDAD